MYIKNLAVNKSEIQQITHKAELSTEKESSKDPQKESYKSIGQELDEISLFIQRFADSHVVDQIRIIKDTDASIKQKMDTLDWLARNSEFVSTDSISNWLKEFKDL